MKGLYLYLMLFTISFPLIRSFEPKVQYATRWKSLFIAIGIVAAFFIIWDIRFTALGVWGFSEAYTLDLRIMGLPLEEWSFFITVPFASVFIYDVIHYFFPQITTNLFFRVFSAALGVLLLTLSSLNIDKNYTFWNFLFAGTSLIVIAVFNPNWLGRFWLAYFIHLVPFFIINGILTGSYLEDPIVWYSSSEIMGIRLGTIPAEDTIYALLLLILNIAIYEGLNAQWALIRHNINSSIN